MKSGIGLSLSRRFYDQIIRPVMAETVPKLPYAAARIGLGSEVLGFDSAMSADHDYGPCVQIFLPTDAFPKKAHEIMRALDLAMPTSFEGFAVRYPTATRPPGAAVEHMLGSDHGAELYTVAAWRERFLGLGFDRPLSSLEWLSYPEHLFLMVTAGAVFRDDVGTLLIFASRFAIIQGMCGCTR